MALGLSAFANCTARLHLNRSVEAFAHVLRDWDDSCGGGLRWAQNNPYKNAITNELLLASAAKLFLLTRNDSYLEWATKEWRWFEGSGLINGDFLVNDGLLSNCANNGGATWTYNQGVVLSGLGWLSSATGNSTLQSLALRLAYATMTQLVDEAAAPPTLQEPCEAAFTSGAPLPFSKSQGLAGVVGRGAGGEDDCNTDGKSFKGIWMRHAAYLLVSLGAVPLALEDQAVAGRLQDFITTNSDAVWTRARSETSNECGLVWNGPYEDDTDGDGALLQASAMGCLNAAATVAELLRVERRISQESRSLEARSSFSKH